MKDKEVWYEEGLRFRCTECGKCCTGAPGYVWLTLEEISEIAEHLDMTPEAFAKQYLRQVGSRYSLKETTPHFDCIFLKGKMCSIYPVRPKQCRTYPFWPQILESREAWQREAERCEGICEEAEPISADEINHLQGE